MSLRAQYRIVAAGQHFDNLYFATACENVQWFLRVFADCAHVVLQPYKLLVSFVK